jgi:hypothetical protein
MTVLERILDTLPPPYAVADDAVIRAMLDDLALELDVLHEDLDRMRRTRWVDFAYRFLDLQKLAGLLGIDPIPGETLESFRVRLLALVAARLEGAVGPADVRAFVHDYVRGVEQSLQSIFVPGLARYDAEQAFATDPAHPGYRPLELVENPLRMRRSGTLRANQGRVPYLFRWEESNRGLRETFASLVIGGLPGGRTAVPLVVNTTTHDLIGYSGVLRFGQRLELVSADDALVPRRAVALLDGRDVTQRIFSISGFELGIPFTPGDHDPQPLLPRLARGANEWTYLSAGLYDVRGLDRVFFAIADAQLREGVFDETFFEHAVLQSGPVATLEMSWTETEPASFEVHVPRYLVIASPEVAAAEGAPAHELLSAALGAGVADIHAAGVRAQVIFDAFRETQAQQVRTTLPWIVTDPELGPVGEGARVSLGGLFGETDLDTSRFQ